MYTAAKACQLACGLISLKMRQSAFNARDSIPKFRLIHAIFQRNVVAPLNSEFLLGSRSVAVGQAALVLAARARNRRARRGLSGGRDRFRLGIV